MELLISIDFYEKDTKHCFLNSFHLLKNTKSRILFIDIKAVLLRNKFLTNRLKS